MNKKKIIICAISTIGVITIGAITILITVTNLSKQEAKIHNQYDLQNLIISENKEENNKQPENVMQPEENTSDIKEENNEQTENVMQPEKNTSDIKEENNKQPENVMQPEENASDIKEENNEQTENVTQPEENTSDIKEENNKQPENVTKPEENANDIKEENNEQTEEIVATISVEKEKIRIEKGTTQEIRISCYPKPKDFLATGAISENLQIAYVAGYTDDCQKFSITGMSVGTTTIRFEFHGGTSQGWIYDDLIVEVYENIIPVNGIILDKTSEEIIMGQREVATIGAKVTPKDATNRNVIWKSSNENVAKPHAYKVPDDTFCEIIPVGEGTCIFTATTEDGGFCGKVQVNIKGVRVTGFEIIKQGSYYDYIYDGVGTYIDKPLKLGYYIFPHNATNKRIKWKCLQPDIASVDENGVVAFKKIGLVDIVGETEDGGFSDLVVVCGHERLTF